MYRLMLLVVSAAIAATTSMAQVIRNSDNLPPSDSSYVGQFHARYASGLVQLSNPIHDMFTNSSPPPGPGGTTTHSFGSRVSADVSISGGTPARLTANADCTVIVRWLDQIGNLRIFETEMTQLDISGGDLPAGVMIRESPTLPSMGRTTIEDIGGGMYRIDSFFDIFTELTLSGGQTWFPTESGAGRVTLVPEPASLSALALGLIAVARRRRR